MIARFATLATEAESDKIWFADRRRQFRFRDSLIVTRDGSSVRVTAPAASMADADDDTLGHIFRAYARVAARSHPKKGPARPLSQGVTPMRSTEEYPLAEAVQVAIDATPVLHPDNDHFAAIDDAAEPLCAALFAAHSAGHLIDQDAVTRRLIERDGLDVASRFVHRFRDALARHAEAGDARFTIEAKLLFKSPRAVLAAAGALGWEIWKAEHPDDLLPAWQDVPVRKVAKHIARRCRDVLSESLSPEEAAWAAIEGANQTGMPIARTAWSDALEGAWAGERERLEAIRRAAESVAA